LIWGRAVCGKHCNKTQTLCQQYGAKADHLQKVTYGKHRYPAKCKTNYNWCAKAKSYNTTGTSHMRYLKKVYLDSGRDSTKGQAKGASTPLHFLAAWAANSSPGDSQPTWPAH
uniref:60S ribosomal protein L37 n=1 Tax=Salvator merianae TaxID=96440 RepID=A0A8D0KP93_SALMN